MKNKSKIKFVSYDGEYPNLCSGTFVVKIGRKTYKFHPYEYCDNKNILPGFWCSGGDCTIDENGSSSGYTAPWELNHDFDEKYYPKEVYERLEELLEVFNENVPFGCCGGCL